MPKSRGHETVELVRLTDLYGRTITFFLILLVLYTTTTALAAPPRMRPYTGIGVVVFPQLDKPQGGDLQLQLYEEPGLLRIEVLNNSRLSGNEWVFGLTDGSSPLIVSARKDGWLRVFYDDAGRQAWIDPLYKGSFQPWEEYLRLQTVRMLPGLRTHYYRLLQRPGGKQLATLAPKQIFKVLTIEDSWGMVLTDQALIGWLRWRDEDGRLLVGINP